MNNKEKWVLWLKATTATVISILLILEVLIVANESLKLMNKQPWSLCCKNEAVVLVRGSEQIQLGPNIKNLKDFANIFINRFIVLVPPFNLIVLTKHIANFFG